jgi:N-formylglutamate amidohydrolase
MGSYSVVNVEMGAGPLVAAAIHDGHAVREEVAGLLALDDANRMREEDPYTAFLTAVAPTRIVGLRSRFEVDLNRPRDKAVYRAPEDCWGLEVWKSPPGEDFVERSLREYDDSYEVAAAVLAGVASRYGRFVVFDLHSYNHQRGGPGCELAPPAENPEVNLGTGTLDRNRWGRLADRFMTDLGSFDYFGRRLDVRENVRFQGGNFSRWVHQTFPGQGVALAIEFKKFFMDEWTGEADRKQLERMRQALESTCPGVLEELGRR